MSEKASKIPFHVEINRIIELLAKQIYQSPLALLRENTQNAYDAVLQRLHRGPAFDPLIEITIEPEKIVVKDNGIGMTWEELDQSNAVCAPSLAEFRRALEHPAGATGWTPEMGLDGPNINFVQIRLLAQALAAAEIGELQRGNFEGAFENLRAMTGLAQLNKNELSLINGVMRSYVAQMGLYATWEALQAPGWDEEHLAALQRDWEQVSSYRER